MLSPGPAANQYYIINKHTGLYLEAKGAKGSSLVQNTATGALNQLWGIATSDTDGNSLIVDQATSLYMEVKAGSANAGAAIIGSFLTSEASQYWRLAPAPTKVYAFSSGGYTGSFQAFGPGKYDVADLTIGDDTIRSLRVPEGWRVTLYADSGYGGSTQVLTVDASELASMSGKVSSLVVEMPPWGRLRLRFRLHCRFCLRDRPCFLGDIKR